MQADWRSWVIDWGAGEGVGAAGTTDAGAVGTIGTGTAGTTDAPEEPADSVI